MQSRPKTCQLARRAAALERQTALDLNKGFPGNVRMKPNEICCHRLETRLLADCSGGNSRPLHPSGVGGGHFLIKSRMPDKSRTTGSNQRCGPLILTLSLATLVNGLLVTLGDTDVAENIAPRWDSTALGVFFRFQIPDFDLFFGFFSLCHFFAFPDLGLVCCFIVSGTLKSN